MTEIGLLALAAIALFLVILATTKRGIGTLPVRAAPLMTKRERIVCAMIERAVPHARVEEVDPKCGTRSRYAVRATVAKEPLQGQRVRFPEEFASIPRPCDEQKFRIDVSADQLAGFFRVQGTY